LSCLLFEVKRSQSTGAHTEDPEPAVGGMTLFEGGKSGDVGGAVKVPAESNEEAFNLYEEAFTAYDTNKMAVEAIKILIDKIRDVDRAVNFAERVNTSPVWSELAKAMLRTDSVTGVTTNYVIDKILLLWIAAPPLPTAPANVGIQMVPNDLAVKDDLLPSGGATNVLGEMPMMRESVSELQPKCATEDAGSATALQSLILNTKS
jgi:hypothetical protein